MMLKVYSIALSTCFRKNKDVFGDFMFIKLLYKKAQGNKRGKKEIHYDLFILLIPGLSVF